MTTKDTDLRSRAEEVIDLMDEFLTFITEEKEYPIRAQTEFYIDHKSKLDRDFKLLFVSLIDIINTKNRSKTETGKLKNSLDSIEEITTNNSRVIEHIKNSYQYKFLLEKYKKQNIDLEGFENESIFAVSDVILKHYNIVGEKFRNTGTITNERFQKEMYQSASSSKIENRFHTFNTLEKKDPVRSVTNRYIVAEKILERKDFFSWLKEYYGNTSGNELKDIFLNKPKNSQEREDIKYAVYYYIEDNKLSRNEFTDKTLKNEIYESWKDTEFGIVAKYDTYKTYIKEKDRILSDLIENPSNINSEVIENTKNFKAMLEIFTSGDAIPTRDSYTISQRKVRILENVMKANNPNLSKKEFVKALLQDVIHYSAGLTYGKFVGASSGIALVQRKNEFSPADFATRMLSEETMLQVKKGILESLKELSRNEEMKLMCLEIIETIQNNYGQFVIDTTDSKIEGTKIENLILESLIEGINLNKDTLGEWLTTSALHEKLTSEANIGKNDAYIEACNSRLNQMRANENFFSKQSPSTELMSEEDWRKHLGTYDTGKELDEYLFEKSPENNTHYIQ